MNILCCLDDEGSFPKMVASHAQQQNDEVRVFWLRVGGSEKPHSDEPIDILELVLAGKTEPLRSLSVVGAERTIEKLSNDTRRGDHRFLFICHLRIPVAWPGDSAKAKEFEMRCPQTGAWAFKEARPGAY